MMTKKFNKDDEVEFTKTCYLEFYQEREEEVRSREVKKGTKGTIKLILPHSTGWYYAVHLENTEYAWMYAPETVLRWYDNYMDEEARSIVYGGADFEEKHDTCICPIDALMTNGCQCGHLKG